MVEGGMKCVKYLLFAFNLIFAISGIALLVTGIVVRTAYSHYLNFVGDAILSAPILLIVIGAVIFVVAFSGCCGAVKENRCLLITFSILLAAIFILEIAAGITAYVMKDKLNDQIPKQMKKTIQNFNQTGYEGVTDTWKLVQHEMKCCGIQEPADWKKVFPFNVTKTDVPDSCCKEEMDGCGVGGLTEKDKIYQDGCLDTFESWVSTQVEYVGGVGIGIAFIQLLGIVFSCLLAHSIKKEYETV